MGLSVSHDAFQGPYSAFHAWRIKIALAAGLYLELMEGYSGRDVTRFPFPLRWSLLEYDVLHVLLRHSDSDGDIAPDVCMRLADRLEQLLPALPDATLDEDFRRDHWRTQTRQFIEGLRLAASRNQMLEFH